MISTQWTNTTARRELSHLAFGALSDRQNLAQTKEMFIRYMTSWREQIALSASAHYHGLGCHFLQSAIGIVFPFDFRGQRWTFDSWVEHKIKPMKREELPCKCLWFKEECRSINQLSPSKVNKICPFFSVGPRRLDLCWIEGSLLDNTAITAEVETSNVIKRDLAKVHSIFVKSASRGRRGFINPIIHIQLELSGQDNSGEIMSFMKKHWANYTLSPFIIYIAEGNGFEIWKFYLFHRGKLRKSRVVNNDF